MRKSTLVFSIVLASIFILGASAPERPKLSDCGRHLPDGAQYSVFIQGSWDRRPAGESYITVDYRNDDLKSTIDPESEEIKQFQQCIGAAIGS